MKVSITKQLFLENDEYQFILKRYTGKVDKENNPMSTTLGYFKNLESVATKVYMLKIKESTAATMQELVDDHKQIIKDIRETFKMKGVVE